MEINIGIDSKYVEILLELEAFGKFLDRLEKGLKYLSDQEELRNSSSLRKVYDLNDIQIANYDLTELVNHILPRFFRNPALISLYSIYESAVTEIASLLQKKNRKLLNLKDIKGENFLDQTNKYFKHVLAVPIYSDNPTQERLKILMVLRHAIAHCNGRLEAVNEKRREKIKKWIDQNIGIYEYHGDLLISKSFLRQTYLIVKDLLADLIRRVNSTSKGKASA